MLYEQFYDEINAELQMIASIEQEEQQSASKLNIGSGEDQCIVAFDANLKKVPIYG